MIRFIAVTVKKFGPLPADERKAVNIGPYVVTGNTYSVIHNYNQVGYLRAYKGRWPGTRTIQRRWLAFTPDKQRAVNIPPAKRRKDAVE